MSQLHQALLGPIGAGEGAFLVAEELALQQVVGHRGAVDRDHRLVLPVGEVVDRPRHQLLAGAGLTQDQHGGVRRSGDLLDPLEDLLHGHALADELAGPLLALPIHEELDLAPQRGHLDGLAQLKDDLLQLGGLGQKVEGPGVHGGHGALHRGGA